MKKMYDYCVEYDVNDVAVTKLIGIISIVLIRNTNINQKFKQVISNHYYKCLLII